MAENAITLLDGGIGQEIVRRAGDRPTPLWSTQAMLDHPGVAEAVHRDYFAAGATIATTNSYAVHRDRLRPHGIEDLFEPLLDRAVAEALVARAAHGSGRIAGAVGPLGASYRPDLCPPVETAAPLFGELVHRLAPRVDLIIFETVASTLHAEGALAAARDAPVPVWLSVTVEDDDGARLRSGEPLADLLPIVASAPPSALLVNCSRPEVIGPALEILRGAGLPYGAYANGFERIEEAFLEERPTVDVLTARDDLNAARYADFALEWVEIGATIVGGCCETRPPHIAALAERLRRSGYAIV